MNLLGTTDIASQSNLLNASQSATDSADSGFSNKLQQAFSSLLTGDKEEAVDSVTESDSDSSTPYDISIGYTDVLLMATPIGQANLLRDMVQEQVTEQFKAIGKEVAASVVTGMMGELSMVAALAESIAGATENVDGDENPDVTGEDDDTSTADLASTALDETADTSGGVWSALTNLFSSKSDLDISELTESNS